MVISGNPESQEAQSQDSDVSVQEQESSTLVQADVGRKAVRMIPDHIGKSIKVTQGYKISLHGPKGDISRGRSNGYHRHGFSLDLLDWLEANIGTTVGQHLWEQGLGDWLHTGSRWTTTNPRTQTLMLDFWIRDRRKAMIFKLVWHARL